MQSTKSAYFGRLAGSAKTGAPEWRACIHARTFLMQKLVRRNENAC
jgi:hypothetical protein